MSYKILFIDDDRNVLQALERELEGVFDFETAASAAAGLVALEKNGPFAVIVSDYFMPGMDGIELLSRARQTAPDCVRLMLTGHTDLATAIDAVNQGNIFRLLTKPWDHDLLVQSLNAAIAQYRLVMVEKELLAKTIKLTESLTKERQNLQVTNRKLQEAIESVHYLTKRANTSNVAKTEFLANMSHELRTPLSGIIGMLDLALDTSLDEQQREYIGLAKYSANTLLNIVNDILDFARIEAGKLVMAHAAFSLKNLIHATLGALKLKAESKKLKLEYELSEKLPDRLMGDSDRLRQILIKLLGNALKFTEQGGITLKITELETENRLKLQFSVADTGVGIPQEKLRTIFDSFTQADGSISRKFGGTGLGLSISKSLVEKMGGEIWAESLENKGSAFYFTAFFDRQPDLSTEPAKTAEAFESMRATAHSVKPAASRPAILLVEDDEINRSMVAHILSKKGYEVKTATDGREAAHMAQTETFDLILMDIQMPGLDGVSAARLIRETDNPVPIIALSAGNLETDRERYQAAGIDACADKPIDWEELFALIERHLPVSAQKMARNNSNRQPAPMEFSSGSVHNPKDASPKTGNHFFEQASQELSLLKEALNRGLEDAIETHARQIKKLAAYSGVGRISDEAFRLELAVRRGDKESYSGLVQRIALEIDEYFKKINSGV